MGKEINIYDAVDSEDILEKMKSGDVDLNTKDEYEDSQEEEKEKIPSKNLWELEEEEENEEEEEEKVEDSKEEDEISLESLGFKDEKELFKEFIDYKKKIEGFDSEKGELLAAKKELEEKLKTTEEGATSLIDDEDILRLNIAKNNNDPNYKIYGKLVTEGLDSINNMDAIRMKYLEEMPEYKDKKSLLDKFIKREYGIVPPPEGYEEDDEEYKEWQEDNEIKNMRLQRDATRYKSQIEENFNKIEIPKIGKANKGLSEEELVINKTNAKKAWSPYIEDAAKEISKFEMNIEGLGDKDIPFKYEVPSDVLATYQKKIVDYVYEHAIPTDEKSASELLAGFRQVFLIENMDSILKARDKFIIEKYDELFDNEINPRSSKKQDTHTKRRDKYDDQVAAALKKLKG